MVIGELFSLLPRPAKPVEQGFLAGWGGVTSKLGGPLPSDYMQFIDVYGSGKINGFLTVFNPFSANPNVNLLDQIMPLPLRSRDGNATGVPGRDDAATACLS